MSRFEFIDYLRFKNYDTRKRGIMKKVKIVYWQDGEMWLGYLQDYPDYMTQGETFEELQENLRDIYEDIKRDCFASLAMTLFL
jgi:hypothetical protein